MALPLCPPYGGQRRVRAGSASWGVGVPSVRRLKTAEDVRVALAKLYRDLERDEVDPKKGRVLVYVLATLSSVIRDSDIEKRLEALEADMEGGGR